MMAIRSNSAMTRLFAGSDFKVISSFSRTETILSTFVKSENVYCSPSARLASKSAARFFSTQPLLPPFGSSSPELDDRRTKGTRPPPSSSFYPHLSTLQLTRAAVSLTICQWPWLVRNAQILLDSSKFFLGKRVTETLLRATLYGHFCAGKDERHILPTLERLKEFGIGSMLDFAAEQEATPGPWNAADEAVCDQHAQYFIHSIRAASVLGPAYASIAAHPTSLANPKAIEAWTTFLDGWEQVFTKYAGKNGALTLAEMMQVAGELYQGNETKQNKIAQRIGSLVDPETGMIDLVAWMSLIQAPDDLVTLQCSDISVSPEHIESLKNFYQRGLRLAHEAVVSQCRLYFDAEQVRYQHAIDHLVQRLQQKVNTTMGKKPVVCGTIQSYRKDASDRLKLEVQRAKRFGYAYGVKLVRGAYMESERAWAEKLGLPSPIHETIQATHDCYNTNVDFLLQQAATTKAGTTATASKTIEICLATHNQDSIQLALMGMEKYGVNKDAVTFGQLYGMHDHLTFSLAKQGNRAFKYVPYGEQDVLLPYLIRRAQENSSVSSGAKEELRRIFKELRQRVIGF